MNWINGNDVLSTLISHDFIISRLDIGIMKRVKRDGASQKGWYVVHEITLDDGRYALIGAFGYFIGAEKYVEKIAPGDEIQLSTDQLAAIKKKHAEANKQAEIQRAESAEKASKAANAAWFKYVGEGESTYLQRKNVRSHGLKFAPSGNGTLAVPMKDLKGKVWGLQIIRGKDRGNKLEKEYWPKGLNKKGHFHLIGSINRNTKTILVAEGYATSATLFQATDLPVAVAFDAGNLIEVAKAIHKEYPNIRQLICADDDYLSEGNPGVKAAESASLAVNGAWIKPIFEADREGKKLTDFNDLANFPNCSESTVMVQIESKLNQLGWGSAPAPAVRVTTGGGGEYKRNNAVSVMELDDAVERFIPLDDGTGEYVFDTWTRKIVKQKQMIAVLAAGVRGDDVKRHYVWQTRGAYYLDQIGFDPSLKDARVKLNTWTGWELKPKAGKCDRILQTLEHLCSKEQNSDDVLWWVLKWMAYPLQNPGAKMGSAIIMHGPQGTGKSLIFRVLAEVYGKYSTVIGNSGIEDKFNADWSDSKLFILAEEIATSADKWNIKNELKELVTGETLRVRAMHMNAYHQKNQMNICFLSNEDMPLPIENDDRRHLVVYTPASLPEEHYVEALVERDNGGIEAFYHYLMTLDLTGFTRHTRPPATVAKQNLMNLSLPSDKRFIKEWLDGETKYPCCPCLSMDLYRAYLNWCKVNGETRPRPSNQFLGMINNLTGWESGLKRIYSTFNYTGTAQPSRIIIPPQIIKAKNGDTKEIYKEKPADLTESQWLTGCVLDFKDKEGDANDA